MVLVRLTEEQIAEYWHVIKFTIEKSVPPIPGEARERLNNVLRALLLGKLQCWTLLEKFDSNVIKAVLTTRVTTDDVLEINTLVLYSLFAFKKLDEVDVQAFEYYLGLYATAQNCKRVVAFTNSNSIHTMLSEIGFKEDWHYLTLEL